MTDKTPQAEQAIAATPNKRAGAAAKRTASTRAGTGSRRAQPTAAPPIEPVVQARKRVAAREDAARQETVSVLSDIAPLYRRPRRAGPRSLAFRYRGPVA